jgi:protein SDA1
MTLGLRTITEMVVKNPQVISQFNINYLAGYSKYRNKNVSNSAKNLINRYREFNPQLLERKYRGR